ncbi:hypothetical protein HDU91_002652, partial [Kappamyces sp. JEL0680]
MKTATDSAVNDSGVDSPAKETKAVSKDGPQESKASDPTVKANAPAPTGFTFGATAAAQDTTNPKPLGNGLDKPAASGFFGSTPPSNTFSFPKPDSSKSNPFAASTGASVTASPAAPTAFNFAAAGFSQTKPQGWTCSACMVPNKADAAKCVSCETAKPGSEKDKPTDPPKSAATNAFSFAKPDSSKNNPFAASTGASVTASPAAPTAFNFAAAGFSQTKPQGWTCSACMVPNKADAAKCVSCETAKPGSEKDKSTDAPKPAAFKPPSVPAGASGFTFGGFGSVSDSKKSGVADKPKVTTPLPGSKREEAQAAVQKPQLVTPAAKPPKTKKATATTKNQVIVDKFDEFYESLQADFESLTKFVDTVNQEINAVSTASSAEKSFGQLPKTQAQ